MPCAVLRAPRLVKHPPPGQDSGMNNWLTKDGRRREGWWADLIRYGLCGVLALAADYVMFGLATRWGWPMLPSAAVARSVGGVVSFALNRWWTFRHRGEAALPTLALRFGAVWIVMFVWAMILISTGHWVWFRVGVTDPWARWLGKVGGDGLAAFTGFLLNRHWTFRGRRASEV